jgi:hypothetical protein
MSKSRGARLITRFAPTALIAALVAACGNGAVGVGACRQIEEARCRRAPSCPAISLEPPFHTSGGDVDACIRFYDVACLHGLIGSAPSAASVNACVAAIDVGTCDVVVAPETNAACAWLEPPVAVIIELPTTDAASDGSNDAVDETVDE